MPEKHSTRSFFDLAELKSGATPLAEMYRALVEEIPAILYINGPGEDSPTLFVSPQTTQILGLDPEGWYDDSWSRHVHPQDRQAMHENYVMALRHGGLDADEYRFIRPDGEEIWLHDTIRVIRDDEGKPVLVQGVMFDITERKRSEELLARQSAILERVAAISQDFTELLLAGGELQDILDALVRIVGCPVVFDDAARQLVAFSVVNSGVSSLLESWETHSRLMHVGAHSTECQWVPVRLRDEDWGRLHMISKDTTDEIDALALDRAAAAIGIWLLSNRDRAALADRARSEFITDLWQGRKWSAEDTLARSRTLGGDLDHPVLMGVAIELVVEGASDRRLSGFAPERMLLTVRDELRRITLEAGLSGIVAVVDTYCLAIIGLDSEARARSEIGRLAARLQAAMRKQLPDRSLSVGVSRPSSAGSLRRSVTEAVDAASHGAHTLESAGVYHSADLGLRQLLARLTDGPDLGRFVEDELGPLLEHDATGKNPFIPTLRAYLDCGGQKATAARILHLERRSLYYRLERIESLLQVDLDDPAARLRAQVALQGLDVLRQRHSEFAPLSQTHSLHGV